MGSIKFTRFDGSAAVGDIATTTNLGGDPLGTVQPTSGVRWLKTAVGAARQLSDTTSNYLRGDNATPAEVRGGGLFFFDYTGVPAAEAYLCQSLANTSRLVGASISTAGNLRMNTGTANTIDSGTGANFALPGAGIYGLEIIAEPVNGIAELRVLDTNFNVLFERIKTGLATIGTVCPDFFRAGGPTNVTAWTQMHIRDLFAWGDIIVGDKLANHFMFATPTGTLATPLSTSQIKAQWDAVATAVSYDLEIQNAAGSVLSTVTGITATDYTVTGLAANTNRKFRVRAVK